MDNKDKIISLLKETSMDFNLLAEATQIDVEELFQLLKELTEEGKIRKTKKSGIYKINKQRSAFTLDEDLSEETIFHLIKDSDCTDLYSLMEKTRSGRITLITALQKLIDENKIRHIADMGIHYYTIPKMARILVSESGNARAVVEGREDPYFITASDDGLPYDGDMAEILPLSKYENTALIDRITERAHTRGVGILKRKTRKRLGTDYYFIETNTPKFLVHILIDEKEIGNALPDMIVTCDIEYGKDGKLYGHNLNVIGHKDDLGMKISEIALEFGFNLDFPEEVREEVKSVPASINKADFKGRRDFTNLDIITIDGDDSKDFDDAVYLEVLPDGNYSLGVYIADVSEYVKENHPLNKEALIRGTSLYLADRVIPMLPHELSNGICSLNPEEDRLVLACIMEIDPSGKLVNYEITEGIINSHHRMTYNKVNKILNGDPELCEEYQDIVPMLNEMQTLSNIIRRLRYKKGGIEFDTVEYSFKLNEDGSPREIVKRERDRAEMLIEDFMLMANETVAYHMNIMNLPIVYRIHEKPDQERLRTTLQDVKSMGMDIKMTQNDIHPKQLQEILEKAGENPNKYIINNMILRSMMKAKYSESCLGHYGLAMNYYCHFTSPIRRYPDLMTHRMIKKLLLHPSDHFEEDLSYYNSIIPEIAMKNSSSERRSVDCERAVDDMLYAWYMEKNVGNTYDAIITSVTPFGMFAEIGNGIEGCIMYRNCDTYFDYNEKSKTAFSNGKTYHIGDKIKVVCMKADRNERRIDFTLPSRRYLNEDNLSE